VYSTTSDIGWGCMVRTGQMMLAKTLLTYCFNRDWLSSNSNLWGFPKYRTILQLFGDRTEVPFSIHNLIWQHVLLRGGIDHREVINGGEWFSPNKIAKTMEHVVNTVKPEGIIMYVPSDGIIYIDRVLSLCVTANKDKPTTTTTTNQNITVTDQNTELQDSLLLSFERNKILDSSFIQVDAPQSPTGLNTALLSNMMGTHLFQKNSLGRQSSRSPHSPRSPQSPQSPRNPEVPIISPNNPKVNYEEWKPLFIMVTSRIGLERMNPIYIDHIQHILRSKNCVGIIGGKPRESVYFIGYQDNQIIYLDPHFVQAYIPFDSDSVSQKDFMTYQCRVPLKMPIQDIDPSLAIGFFFPTRSDFDIFVQEQNIFASNHTSIFTVEQIEPDYVQSEEAEFKFINLNK